MTLEQILAAARRFGASDVHLTAGRSPSLRVNGSLSRLEDGPLDDVALAAMTDALVPQRLQRNLEVAGQADFAFTDQAGERYRGSAFRQRGHLALALRLIPRLPPTPAELHLPESVVRLADRPHGMVIVTGPTGSGKTTTLAALIDRLNGLRPVHILTLEDPIEYVYPVRLALVNQREMAWTPRASLRVCARHCGRTPTSSSWARCATQRRWPPR